MYLENGWKPREEPAPTKPQARDQDERILLWLIVASLTTFTLAPIGGITIIEMLLR